MTDLFDIAGPPNSVQYKPLAERVRPERLDELLGQDHILGTGKPLRQLLEGGRCPSLLFWGPPGCGKTTLARIISRLVDAEFVQLSAVTSGIRELKDCFEQARTRLTHHGRKTILFIDEIHRYNKAQQDALLPFVESGMVTFIGATTENPSFEVVSALLSRCQVVVLNPLTPDHLVPLLDRAVMQDATLMRPPQPILETGTLERIALLAAGDARIALNGLETCLEAARQRNPETPHLTMELVREVFQSKALRYDKSGEEHYNLISALHKSMRGSDPDASLYWLYRMIDSGEDCLFILRRLVRFASEDVGMADPFALTLAMSATQAFQFVGPPEGHLHLAQLAVYLACAPKSNALYMAEKAVREEIHSGREPGVPLHLRNAPTKLMKDLDYSHGYRYPHDYPGGFVRVDYFPQGVQKRCFYEPKVIGKERAIRERLAQLWPERYSTTKQGS